MHFKNFWPYNFFFVIFTFWIILELFDFLFFLILINLGFYNVIAAGSLLLCAGGLIATGVSNRVDIYNTSSGIWTMDY